MNEKKLDRKRKKSNPECRHCNDKFSLREELLAHLAEHNNSKPFKCSICGQGFGLQSSVKRHEKTHAMKKPNVCAQCDKKFARKSDLVNHMKVNHFLNSFFKSITFIDNTEKYESYLCWHVCVNLILSFIFILDI